MTDIEAGVAQIAGETMAHFATGTQESD